MIDSNILHSMIMTVAVAKRSKKNDRNMTGILSLSSKTISNANSFLYDETTYTSA